ncbi:MAG: ammonium transporter [Verrucomicrobia bacterium]|nr:ammonium transporter [Verrucomicrobiota bacterium]
MKLLKYILPVLISSLAVGTALAADAPAPSPLEKAIGDVATMRVGIDTLWVMVAGILVFFMNTGFGCVESGLCRQKNTVNILAKNFIVFAIASLSFYVIGWGLMFGNGNALFGTSGIFGVGGDDNSPATGDAYKGAYKAIAWAGVPLWAKFFFQLVFAGTAATIVSGAVAERIKFSSFLIFSFILAAVFYPVTGHWIWGGGWLAAKGFWDFAGSTVVHSVGGWAALAGVIVLGPRLGKFGKDGRVHPIPGHSMTSVFLGVFILWVGWFGFNPGSTMAVGDGSLVAHVFVTTNMAAAMGAIGAMITAWLLLGKPDFTMIANGCLAGLVAITAPCAFVSAPASLVIGLIAGVLVVLAVIGFDKARLDDPVGALSVHLVNGIWGTLAVGLFAKNSVQPGTAGNGLFNGGGLTLLVNQFIGVVAVGAFTFIGALVVWFALKKIMGIRVTPEEETEGLDIGEHGNESYPDFLTRAPGSRHS